MKNKIKYILIPSLFLVVFLFGSKAQFRNSIFAPPSTAYAASDFQGKMESTTSSVEERGLVPCTLSQCTFCHLLQMIERIFFWLLTLAFAVAVLFVVISGFAYIMSIGDSSMMGWAKEGLKLSIVGFVICIVSWFAIHMIYLLLGYKGDSWWRIECNTEETTQTEAINNQAFYANEVLTTSIGGRDNPASLPELASQGISQIPENKYFFIHGLGGQPLESTAKQLAELAKKAKKEGTSIFVATPLTNSKTFEIEGTNLNNLTNYINKDSEETIKNFKTLVTRIASDSTSTEIPLIKGTSVTTLPKFSNNYPQKVFDTNKSVATMVNGALYKENDIVTVEKEANTGLDYTVNLKNGILDRENPITFQINREDVSMTGAKETATKVAEVMSESVKDSLFRNKDQANQAADLMAKEGEYSGKITTIPDVLGDLTDPSSNSVIYSPGFIPSYTRVNIGQTIGEDKIAKLEDELGKVAKNVIDKNLGSSNKKIINNEKPTSISTTPNTASQTGNIRTYSDVETPELDDMIAKERQFVGGIDVDRVRNYDSSELSPIGGKITTGNILSLKEREDIRDMLLDIQKEMADTSEQIGGKGMNVPADWQMCLFYKETFHHTTNSQGKKEPESFDASAWSSTYCSGLGQLSMGSTKDAVLYLKKYAPKHFIALSEKIQKNFGVDMEKTLTKSGGNNLKRDILRKDPNLNAALAYALSNYKQQSAIGKPIKNTQANSYELRRLANWYGPGDDSYANLVMQCFQNQAWRKISEAGQKAIDSRINK